MSWRITRSATSSCSVGSLLMITSLAPQFLRHQRKTCGRPNDERRSDGQEQIAVLRQFGGAAHLIFRHRLSERDRRGLHRLLAGGAVGGAAAFFEARLYPGKIIGLSAADAAGIGGIAVQFDHVIGLEA